MKEINEGARAREKERERGRVRHTELVSRNRQIEIYLSFLEEANVRDVAQKRSQRTRCSLNAWNIECQ